MKYTVEDFYSKKFEDESNEILLNERWLFSEKAMADYVIQITNISISDYISYCESLPSIPNYTSKDITQLSSLYDCTLGMCKALKEVDGHTPMEVLCGCLLGFFVGLSFCLLK